MNSFFLRESVLLAVLPLVSFVGALLFEVGYAGEFGYSYSFISIDLKAMVVSLACSVVILIPVLLFSVGVFRIMSDTSKEVRVLGLEFFLPVIALIGVCITGFSSRMFILFFLSSLTFAVSKYAFIILKGLKYGLKGSLSRAAESEGLTDRSIVREGLAKLDLGNKWIFHILLAVVLVLLAFMVRGAGQGFAQWRSDYQTVNMNGGEYAILSAYGDLVVLGGIYDEQFNGVISIVPRNSEKLVELRNAYLPSYLPGICAIGKCNE